MVLMSNNDAEFDKSILVIINKKETILEEGITVIELLEYINAKQRSAVWINGKQLLQSEYPSKVILEGDEVKVLRVVAGG
jgi:thiamine biosynthesis protein ThiS